MDGRSARAAIVMGSRQPESRKRQPTATPRSPITPKIASTPDFLPAIPLNKGGSLHTASSAASRSLARPCCVGPLRSAFLRRRSYAVAQRISVGGGLTWVAAKAFADAATAIRDEGDLSVLSTRLPLGEWLA
jgi:hypothetical protein